MTLRRNAAPAGRQGGKSLALRYLLAGWVAVLALAVTGFAEFGALPGLVRTMTVGAAAAAFTLGPLSFAVTVAWLEIRSGSGRTVAYDQAWRHSRRLRVITRVGRCFGALFMLFAVAVLVAVVPAQVNSAAYLAGAGRQALFIPAAHVTSCGEPVVTTGTLGTAAGAAATWPGRVPVGRPFSVRTPVWNAPCEADITSGDGDAIGTLAVGVFADGVVLFMTLSGIGAFRRRRAPHDAHAGSGRPYLR